MHLGILDNAILLLRGDTRRRPSPLKTTAAHPMVIVIVKLRTERGRRGHAGREKAGGHGVGAGAGQSGVHGCRGGGRHGHVGVERDWRSGRGIRMGAIGRGQGRWTFPAEVGRSHRRRGRGRVVAVVRWQLGSGRRMALTILDAASDVIRARRALVDSGGCHLVGAIVDGGLRLLHDLIHEEKIILRPQVVQSGQLILRGWRIDPDLRASAAQGASSAGILGQSSIAHERQLTGLNRQQTALDLGIRLRVEVAALRVVIEIVQRADALISNIQAGMVSSVPTLVRGVEDMAVARRVRLLRRTIVSLGAVRRLMIVTQGRVRLQLLMLLLLVTVVPIWLVLVAHAVMAILIGTIPVLLVRRAHQHGVFGVRLDVFLQILRPFERLATKLTSMRFQWHVDTDVGGDVVPLDDLNLTVTPPAGEIEIVGALATDVGFANVIIKQLGGLNPLPTVGPLADVGVVAVAGQLGDGLLGMNMMMLMLMLMLMMQR